MRTGVAEGAGNASGRGRSEVFGRERQRKRGSQEKPKWVNGQVTWRRTGPNVQDGDTLSYSSSGRSWPLQVLRLPIQEMLRDTVAKMSVAMPPHNIFLSRYSSGEKIKLLHHSMKAYS